MLIRLLPALLAVITLALPSAGCRAETADDRAFGERVRVYLLAHPEVLQEMQMRLQAQQQGREDAAAATAVASHRPALEHDPRDYVAGNPNGSVTMVEFFDYRCPFCRSSANAILKWLAVHKNVRLVLKELPMLSESSEHAARAAIAARDSGRYLPIHEAFLAEKNLDDAAIARVLTAQGVDAARDKVAGVGPAATRQLQDVHTLAGDLGINATPTVVVGGKLIPGWIPADIEAAISGKPAA